MTDMRTLLAILITLALGSACASSGGGSPVPAASAAPSVQAAPLGTPLPSGHPDVDYYGY